MRKNRSAPFLTLLLATTLAPELHAAETGADRTRPDYRRDGARRPALDRPKPPEAPEALRPEARDPEAATRRPPVSPERIRELSRLAAIEARWAAEELSRGRGSIELFRVGVYEGLHRALDDESLGSWDYVQGVRLGLIDREALAAGVREGAKAADARSAVVARSQVETMFTDLSTEIRFAPRLELPAFEPPQAWAEPPTVRDIFFELGGSVARSAEFRVAFDGWRHDPWGLYGCASVDAFHEAGWSHPSQGWELWAERSRRSSRILRDLRGGGDREAFRDLFERSFASQFPRFHTRFAIPAFDLGFEEGWELGAAVRQEHSYRSGYTEGFDRAAATAAAAEFRASWAGLVERHYDLAFGEWSSSIRPAILDVRVRDDNDDGVFQPGEPVRIDYRLANYGGGSGELPIALDGSKAGASAATRVRLDGRGVDKSNRSIEARVAGDAAVRMETAWTLRAGEASAPIRLWISHPLEFPDEPRVERIDALAGTALVAVHVANTSRKSVPADVRLEWLDGRSSTESVDLGTIPPGVSRVARFTVAELNSLDLLEGGIEAHLSVVAGTRVHDRSEAVFPDLAGDLHDRELFRVLVSLSNETDASPAEIAEVRSLLLRRIRADWAAAVRVSGNPYKRDFKGRTATTALGDLVRTYELADAQARRSVVWNGMGGEIEEFTRDLPGVHPRLRKFAKRLARKLG